MSRGASTSAPKPKGVAFDSTSIRSRVARFVATIGQSEGILFSIESKVVQKTNCVSKKPVSSRSRNSPPGNIRLPEPSQWRRWGPNSYANAARTIKVPL